MSNSTRSIKPKFLLALLAAALAALLAMPLAVHAAKPRPPLQVSIAPMQSDLLAAAVKPGDVVELKIIGKTFVDASELSIKVRLYGKMEWVSGETTWSGPLKKGEEKLLLLTVRMPKQGHGRIMARMATPPTPSASFAAEAEYEFGSSTMRKPAELPAIKKDGKGREIREYPIN